MTFCMLDVLVLRSQLPQLHLLRLRPQLVWSHSDPIPICLSRVFVRTVVERTMFFAKFAKVSSTQDTGVCEQELLYLERERRYCSIT